jgi:hypothetical protein
VRNQPLFSELEQACNHGKRTLVDVCSGRVCIIVYFCSVKRDGADLCFSDQKRSDMQGRHGGRTARVCAEVHQHLPNCTTREPPFQY